MTSTVLALPRPSAACNSMSFGVSAGIMYQRRWLQAARCGSGIVLQPQPAPPTLRKRTSPLLDGQRSSSFTMSKGQYIAPEKIENVLHTSWFVAQAIVFGDEFHESLVAVIVPEDYALRALATQLAVPWTTVADICEHPSIVHHVLRDLTSVSKEGNLCGFETVRAITLRSTRFTAESGILLRSRKVDRAVAKARFQTHIDAMQVEAEASHQRRRHTRSA